MKTNINLFNDGEIDDFKNCIWKVKFKLIDNTILKGEYSMLEISNMLCLGHKLIIRNTVKNTVWKQKCECGRWFFSGSGGRIYCDNCSSDSRNKW